MFHLPRNAQNRCRNPRNESIPSSRNEKIEEVIARSPVPGMAMFALIWVVCALFLTLSIQHRREFNWRLGQAAPESVYAQCDFSYEDVEATEKERQFAANNATRWYYIDPVESKKIEECFRRYFDGLVVRASGRMLDSTTPVARQVNQASVELVKFLGRRHDDFLERSIRTVRRGIMPFDERTQAGIRPVKVTDLNGNNNPDERTAADYPDAELAAKRIAGEQLFPEGDLLLREEFITAIRELIGEDFNIRVDEHASANSRIEAVHAVKPVIRMKHTRDLILEKGDVFTQNIRNMLDAQRRVLPVNFEERILLFNLVGGMILLAIAIFYLAILRPEVIRNPRHVAVAAITICFSLWINYLVIGGFDKCLRDGIVSLPQLIVCAIPVALPMLLMSVTLGIRVAFIVGFLIVTVTALMVAPDQQRPLELVVRWILIGGIGMLAVRRVVSYRAFFVRIFVAMVLLNGFFNFDLLYRTGHMAPEEIVEMVKVIVFSGFLCAVAALVMIFALELIFNLDTDMALTVLGNFSHPLLERLKREAPGTMFHSITVATLAEDAARAIGANALRAKVGALFHDIGKLRMPQYFIENNRDSADMHALLSPRVSAIIIRNHVQTGLELARKYRLFHYIRDVIATHHGNDLVRYFYNEARKRQRAAGEPENAVREEVFRYQGKPPHQKELVIISIADACEAATRSISTPTAARVEEMVDDIIDARMRGGQLSASALTLAELAVVRKCLIKTLISIHHGRIAYSHGEKDETACERLARQKSAAAKK